MEPIFWALLLLAAGLLVVVVELFVPSAGVLGVIAGILIVSAIIVGFLDGLGSGALVLLLAVVALPMVLAFMVKIWPHTPLGKRILIGEIKPEDVLPNSSHYQKRNVELIGRIGVAKTKMLPSGIVIVDDEKYDAISQGFAIEAGDAIKIIDVREHRVYVEPYDGSVEDDLPVRDDDILSQPIEEFGIDSLEDPLG